MPGASFESVTGRLGVGAIAFLGLFLFIDGMQIGVFDFVETYGKSTAWGIVGVIPTAVVTYIIGLICLGIADIVLSRFTSFPTPDPEEIVTISRIESALLEQLYLEHLRNYELLKGTSVSFMVLAAGSIAEMRNMPAYEIVVWVSTVGAIALAILSLLFARRAVRRASDLGKAAQTHGSAEAKQDA